jgi:hypothetical protein
MKRSNNLTRNNGGAATGQRLLPSTKRIDVFAASKAKIN